jgi:hypothetical protein
MKMKMRVLLSGAIALGLVLALAGCNLGTNASRDDGALSVGPASGPASPTPMVLPEEKIDLANYTAETSEAAAVIKQILLGAFEGKRAVDGGISPETLVQRRAARLANRQTPISANRGAPRNRPDNASTRPKITWVGKLDGSLGEAYYANFEYLPGQIYSDEHYFLAEQYTLMSYSEKNTLNGNSVMNDEWGFVSALFQTPKGGSGATFLTDTYWPGMRSNGYQAKTTLSLKTADNECSSGPLFIYNIVNSSTGGLEYAYFDVPASVFEDINAYPIQETWYWDPPWHFEKLAMHIGKDGVFYGATAKEGFEKQFFVYRWSVADFKAAYSGAGGWHEQGWYIKDIDVEEGSVSALLYVPAAPYKEACMMYVEDSTFYGVIRLYWSANYRGLMIDSSW